MPVFTSANPNCRNQSMQYERTMKSRSNAIWSSVGTEKIRAALVAVFLGLVLTACGGGGASINPGSDGNGNNNGAPSSSIRAGGAGGAGGATASVCGDTESYCHTIEKQLNAASNYAELVAVWQPIRDALHETIRSGNNRLPDHDYYDLDAVQQQALTDLFHRREAEFNPPAARQPAAPPQTPPTAPATGSYTGSGPVASWGVWRNDQTAPGDGQRRFGVRTLAEEGFFASYEVTGEVTTDTSSLPNGTATWDGKYGGIYQLGDENGVWGAQTDDSGTASVEVDFASATGTGAVTVTLTSDTTDAKTLPGGSDSGSDTWTSTADLSAVKTTFGKTFFGGNGEPDDVYRKIVGALFGATAEALAGVYEFDYRKDHPTDTRNGEAVRVNDIRGAGWFGGCKDVADFSCFDPDPVTDPVTDPDPDPMDPDPMDPDPVDPSSYFSFGAWSDRPADFDAHNNANEFAATLQATEYYYLKGTRTSSDDMSDLPTTGTATWAGNYVGKYRTHVDDDDDETLSDWSAFTDDSGTVSMVLDLQGIDMAVTLTSATGNTFPGASSGDMPKDSFAFDPTVDYSGRNAGGFYGDQDSDIESSAGSIVGAFFGSGAAAAGGVYSIAETPRTTGVQVEAVGVFGATKQP